MATVSMGEVRKAIANSLTAAFGFVIALVWANVVFGGLALSGASLTAPTSVMGLGVGIFTALILTIFMIVLITLVGRWGNK